MRIIASAAALLLLGGPAFLFGSAAVTVVPRETCQWRDEDFCSDYGPFYWTFTILFALALALVLWAINRKRRGS